MPRYIALVTFQSNSGLSKDRFENVFHFQTPGNADAEVSEAWGCCLRIADFFGTNSTLHAGGPVVSFLSSSTEQVVDIKIYDEDRAVTVAGQKPPPRPVLYEAQFSMIGINIGTPNIPEEIALCLSYYAGINAPRFRGRVYIGPLSTAVLIEGVQVRPAPAFLHAIIDGANRLLSPDLPAPVLGLAPFGQSVAVPAPASVPAWAVKSTLGSGTKAAPVPIYYNITEAWVDNEWDGQRRRRVEASARVTTAVNF